MVVSPLSSRYQVFSNNIPPSLPPPGPLDHTNTVPGRLLIINCQTTALWGIGQENNKTSFYVQFGGQSSDETQSDICESQEFKTRNSLIPLVVTSQLELRCQVFCLLPAQAETEGSPGYIWRQFMVLVVKWWSVFCVIISRVRWGGDGEVLLIIIIPVGLRMGGSGNSILEDNLITSS